MGRTCRRAGEIKKNTHPKNFTALFGEQALLEDTVARVNADILSEKPFTIPYTVNGVAKNATVATLAELVVESFVVQPATALPDAESAAAEAEADGDDGDDGDDAWVVAAVVLGCLCFVAVIAAVGVLVLKQQAADKGNKVGVAPGSGTDSKTDFVRTAAKQTPVVPVPTSMPRLSVHADDIRTRATPTEPIDGTGSAPGMHSVGTAAAVPSPPSTVPALPALCGQLDNTSPPGFAQQGVASTPAPARMLTEEGKTQRARTPTRSAKSRRISNFDSADVDVSDEIGL